MCYDEFLRKEPKEAVDYFEENAQSWVISNPTEWSKKSIPSQSIGGAKYAWREQDGLLARIAYLSMKVKNLEVKKMNEVVSMPQEEPCTIYESVEHFVKECPTITTFKEVLHK